jgi:CHASE2 domain-containing sensor protein
MNTFGLVIILPRSFRGGSPSLQNPFSNLARVCQAKPDRKKRCSAWTDRLSYRLNFVTGWIARKNPLLASALGAALVVFGGLLLWGTSLGEPWTNASYDYLFRFGSRAITNQVTLILMDNGAFEKLGQTRGQPWSRALHARLLNRLADDGCALVVFDSFFREPRDAAEDQALTAAMRRLPRIVLMAKQTELAHPALAGAEPIRPAPEFLDACGTHWGVAWLNPDLDRVVRQQWPFPSPGPYPSLSWAAAELAGKKLSSQPQERWLRYYGPHGSWRRLSYQFALAQPTNYFRNQIVFIGNWPETSLPNDEADKFCTAYTRWTGEASGGVEILLASFLNLVNGESLLRPAWWMELALFSAAGMLLGGGLCRLPLRRSLPLAAGLVVLLALAAILLSYFTNYWMPWLILVGGQVPCAVGWALVVNLRRAPQPAPRGALDLVPVAPGYELVHPPFAEGAYGKVWLARTKAGDWRALKAVYQARFNNDPAPFEREFSGVKKFQPLSDRHPGLLRIDFVSEPKDGYFYYVMELGDSMEPGWESNPSTYKPRDLVKERELLYKRRLPIKECFRIGIALSEALEFLHRQGMTHRDIKPPNIIFVHGQPKLADPGLVTELRPEEAERTLVGTEGFMPPRPERPGTVAADIYALGMVLYVLSTGRGAMLFPEMATTLVSAQPETPDFLALNSVILKACQPLPEDRYASAREFGAALEAAWSTIEQPN